MGYTVKDVEGAPSSKNLFRFGTYDLGLFVCLIRKQFLFEKSGHHCPITSITVWHA